MKKLCKFLLPFLVLSASLVSCGNDEEEQAQKVTLSFGDVHGTIKHVSMEHLQDIIDSKENFLLVVSSTTCDCWRDFKAVLEKYTKANSLVCYEITYGEIKDYAHMYDLYVSSGTTTFAIFENGQKKYTLKSGDSDALEDYEKFKSFMDATIKKPSALYVTEDDIKAIKTSNKAAVVYYERSNCGDCSYINPTMIREYFEAHSNANKLYVIDCREWWKSKSDPQYQTYLDTKTEFGLSNVENIVYGFDGGVFPYFSLIENGSYSSGAVVFNDELEQNGDDYVVSNSYYTTERVANLEYTSTVIKGMSVPKEDATESGYWKQDAAAKVYKPILNDFLDYALPKVNFTF